MTRTYGKFTRTQLMDVAKTIRNTTLSQTNKIVVGRALSAMFKQRDQFFDNNTFMQIISGGVDGDWKTEVYSKVKD